MPPQIRVPSTLPAVEKSTETLVPPEVAFLEGTWHVIYSTLPMWRSKRNVRITYTSISGTGTGDGGPQRIDDLVTYQSIGSEKVQSVRGVDTAVTGGGVDGWAWHWRGKGWLMIASSRWEVLGYGPGDEEEGEKWAVTYFAKTLFTPAGLDIYSRSPGGLSEELLGQIKEALRGIEDAGFQKLIDGLFEVARDV
ncbi:hypothetical protein EYR40_008415 [Pleurotus pulmonarius]|nr:hypothetical protein EYR40_008415 [Pleurotus pulmonarius]